MNINILYEDEGGYCLRKTGGGCGADKTVRTGGHGKPSEKLPGRKGETAVYRGEVRAGISRCAEWWFCQKKSWADLSRRVQTK